MDTSGNHHNQRQYSLRGLLGYVAVWAVLLSTARTLDCLDGSLPTSAGILLAPFWQVWWIAVGGWLGYGVCVLTGHRRHLRRYVFAGVAMTLLVMLVIAGILRARMSPGSRPINFQTVEELLPGGAETAPNSTTP